MSEGWLRRFSEKVGQLWGIAVDDLYSLLIYLDKDTGMVVSYDDDYRVITGALHSFDAIYVKHYRDEIIEMCTDGEVSSERVAWIRFFVTWDTEPVITMELS